jgi:D-alanyl-D-alanine dipeptidase
MVVINGITVDESQVPVQLAEFQAGPRLFLNNRFTDIVQIRPVIIQKIQQALEILPLDKGLMIFESYRPRSRQLVLWNNINAQLKAENPDITEPELTQRAENFVANPYGFGSGHQAAVAIDITLCELDGTELDMGTAVQEFNIRTETAYANLPADIKAHRQLLKSTLEQVGLINYPPEWWHYSYGDRLWAEVTGRDFAFFAPVD